MSLQRCQCKNLTNNKICSRKSKIMHIVNFKRYCTFHYYYHMHSFAKTIQKIYRGYRIRKFLNNVYYKLPDDLQFYVSKVIQRDNSYQKYKELLNNIVSKKISEVINSSITNYQTDLHIPFTFLNYLLDNNKKIQKIFILFKKYESILCNKDFMEYDLKQILKKIQITLNIYEYKIFNAYTNHIHNVAYVLYHRLDNIMYPNTLISSES